MRKISTWIEGISAKVSWLIASAFMLLTNTAQAGDWFPKALVDQKSTNKEAMVMFSDIIVKGFKILLFVVCIVTFVKFVTTVSHGIEEAKKNEGGLMAVFTSYAVMSFIYLSISIVCAYLGFTAVSNFSL